MSSFPDFDHLILRHFSMWKPDNDVICRKWSKNMQKTIIENCLNTSLWVTVFYPIRAFRKSLAPSENGQITTGVSQNGALYSIQLPCAQRTALDLSGCSERAGTGAYVPNRGADEKQPRA